ncbi:MAG: sugar phosphate isomerase/epimerase, partial [Oscillospiraceae bacterium]|nr:sugar phosphate isomerase/epimerase [Oscillospiraceae bacterium]
LLSASEFACSLGVRDVATHVGFIPENPNDRDYHGVVSALRHLCSAMKGRGQRFLFETGQETPTTLLRAIEDIGTGNAGVNFDTANLILYGKANSVDAAAALGRHVWNTHCKDGEFPTCGRYLGQERPLGQGRAAIAEVVALLRGMGYGGPWTIEREISGERQTRDIIAARDLLLAL